jgi:hypothetical protein
MKPDVQMMQEVVVTPDKVLPDVLPKTKLRPKLPVRTILQNAYQRIPENYPDAPVRYNVFYRESLRAADGKYVGVAEAMLDVYKSGYDKPKDKGQVKILKSRKSIISKYDDIVDMYVYGGAFAFVAKDYVFTRAKVINPNDISRFSFRIAEMTRFEGRDIYVIDFTEKETRAKGRLYIEADSYAFVRIDIKSDKVLKDNGFERSKISETVQYLPHEGKWHLQQVTYKDTKKIYSTGMVFDCVVEHLSVTAKEKGVKTIPPKEQLSYTEPFYIKARNYNPNYWEGYNILQQDSALQEALEKIHSLEDINKVMTTGYDDEEVKELLEEARKREAKKKN